MGREYKLGIETVETDVLIIGGGAAGCYAALELNKDSNVQVIIADKAHIERSGCLAAGINALNAYIGPDETIDGYVDYVSREFNGIVRNDLLKTIAGRLNEVTRKIESLGLPILKDESGAYVMRGKRSVKINGERIKPILADAVRSLKTVQVHNQLNIFEYLVDENRVIGAVGYDLKKNKLIFINSKVIVCATGGAAGIYKSNHSASSQHKMWYSPFNTGAGYAMGIRAGAEMTTFEMRFIALRLKDTIAPTGTIAQGVHTPHINKLGELYLNKYGHPTTINRLKATITEERLGNGPCFLDTRQITAQEEESLKKAYLNMAPVQALAWIDKNQIPSEFPVALSGTEPYIVGGHGAAGYWVDHKRRTTLKGLYAIGDVAGGSPKKYVTGCFAEASIAAEAILENLNNEKLKQIPKMLIEKFAILTENLFVGDDNIETLTKIEALEEQMQETMDLYAGGISQFYGYTEPSLQIAKQGIQKLLSECEELKAYKPREFVLIQELRDRLWVARTLIVHLEARKETRWNCYQENLDYPLKDNENYSKFVNSYYKDGIWHVLFREIVAKDETYEHSD